MFRRMFGFPEPIEMPPLVDGEVISLSRPLSRFVMVAIYFGILSFLPVLVYLLFYREPALLRFSISCAFCSLVPIGTVIILIVFKPRLILGYDRIQCASRLRYAHWEVKYEDIAEMKLFSKGGTRFIGINFTENNMLHPIWQCEALRKSRQYCKKRYGYDFCLVCSEMQERPEIVFEAILRCYHRFRDDKQLKNSETPL